MRKESKEWLHKWASCLDEQPKQEPILVVSTLDILMDEPQFKEFDLSVPFQNPNRYRMDATEIRGIFKGVSVCVCKRQEDDWIFFCSGNGNDRRN